MQIQLRLSRVYISAKDDDKLFRNLPRENQFSLSRGALKRQVIEMLRNGIFELYFKKRQTEEMLSKMLRKRKRQVKETPSNSQFNGNVE